jgi:hypothetical protein
MPLKLTGPQLGELSNCLSAAFTDRTHLERFLRIRLECRLDSIAGENESLDSAVWRVLTQAEAEGWVRALVTAAVWELPRNGKLQRWAAEVGNDTAGAGNGDGLLLPTASGTRQQLLDATYFDLEEFTLLIKQAQLDSASRLLAYVVRCLDEQFVTCLCARITGLFGGLGRKPAVTLQPELQPVERAVQDLTRYRDELATSGVLCLVRAEWADPATLQTFWQAVSDELGPLRNYLVLVVTGGLNTEFPAEMTVLPTPTFELAHVSLWATEVLNEVLTDSGRSAMADEWAKSIWAKALDGRGQVDVRYLYEAIHEAIKTFRFERQALYRRLQEGGRCAV